MLSTTDAATSVVFRAVNHRRSYSKVSALAPTRAELLPLVAAAARVADHGALRPWRLLELRGDARERLGAAFVAASACEGSDALKLAAKPLRAPLLIAVVASHRARFTVTVWEQAAAAANRVSVTYLQSFSSVCAVLVFELPRLRLLLLPRLLPFLTM